MDHPDSTEVWPGYFPANSPEAQLIIRSAYDHDDPYNDNDHDNDENEGSVSLELATELFAELRQKSAEVAKVQEAIARALAS